jgi:hypothetical protein
MRRILLIVAMLLVAVPAMGGVVIKARQVPPYTGSPSNPVCSGVEVNFTSDADGTVRAFALDINVDSNFIISAIRDFNTGESKGTKKGYGIFPGSFRDVINPADPCWGDGNDHSAYNPVAPSTDADACGTGLGTNKIIIEMGSLYSLDANKPNKNGMLFRIDVIPPKIGKADCNLTVALNTTRGGVVDNNGSSFKKDVNVTLPTGVKVAFMQTECFPCWKPYNAQYDQWVVVDRPNCWCGQYAPAEVNNWRTQCKGDADGNSETGSKSRVWGNDYKRLVATWGLKYSQIKSKNLTDVNVSICADFDHLYETGSKSRVWGNDYARLVAGWGKKESIMKPWCPIP